MKRTPKQTVTATVEEMKAVVNVAICEAALGYERRFIEGHFQWYRGPQADGGEAMLKGEELPNFFERQELAMDLFARFAMDYGFVPQLRIDNQQEDDPKVCVHVLIYKRGRPGEKLTKIAGASGPLIPPAIALAAVDLYGIPMARLHRDLFPGRYLAAVPT